MTRRPPRPKPGTVRPDAPPMGTSDALLAYAGVRAWQPKAPPPGASVEYMNLLALAEAAAKDGDGRMALEYLHRAAQLEPGRAQPHVFAARVLLRGDEPARAARALAEAIRVEPGDAKAKALFTRLVADLPGTEHERLDTGVIATCLETDGIGNQDLVDIALRRLATGDVSEVLARGATHGWDAAAADLLAGSARHLRDNRLLVGALRQGLTVHVPFERLLTAIRRRVLLTGDGQDDAAGRALIGALAEQCYLNEFVFFGEPDEYAAAAALKDALTARLGHGLRAIDHEVEADLLRVALYHALADVPGCAALLDLDAARWSPPVRRVIDLTLSEPGAERILRDAMPTLAPPQDRVSRLVQAQYEENPYPRWRGITLPEPRSALGQLARHIGRDAVSRLGPTPRILVAGCGTGAHAIPCAVKYGERARVLAVDLSRASLAYARRRAESLGIRSIEFAQADILELDPAMGPASGPFDIIECGGVLHHMADPVAGWRVLAALLRPGGALKLGLYSQRARIHIDMAITDARSHGEEPTPAGIRAFRRRLMMAEPTGWVAALARYRDFYSTGQCRDMVFHVQEHRFTPLGLQAALAEVGLAFKGFQLPGAVLAAYARRFPDDPAGLDLGRWDEFEQANPDTFVAMYQFWCQKP
ncbi:MAG: class I SAM-dependent methyltransferase [Alphaproteobacteria bacterium]